jgi:hypothetical protein
VAKDATAAASTPGIASSAATGSTTTFTTFDAPDAAPRLDIPWSIKLWLVCAAVRSTETSNGDV